MYLAATSLDVTVYHQSSFLFTYFLCVTENLSFLKNYTIYSTSNTSQTLSLTFVNLFVINETVVTFSLFSKATTVSIINLFTYRSPKFHFQKYIFRHLFLLIHFPILSHPSEHTSFFHLFL